MTVRIKLVALVTVFACAAAAVPQVSSGSKEKTRTVDGTMEIAIIDQSEGVNDFAGRFTGKPGGGSAVLGEAAITNTPSGLITESQSGLYNKKGTLRMEATDVVEFQPDGSITLTGTFDVLGGSRKYKGATGGGTFNGTLPPGSSLTVGTVVIFDVDGTIRY
jgi:hypothetical protein